MERQRLLFIVIILFIFSFLFSSRIVAEEESVLDQVVVIETVGDYDEAAAAEMKARINRIHPSFLEVLAEEGIVIKLINFPLTDLPEYAYLKGKVPRGWEETGLTWEDVPGAGGNPTVAQIGKSDPNDPGSGHDDINLELHEAGHAVDEFVFDNISFTEEFMDIHAREKDSFLPDAYFDYVEEYFAEVFAFYYLDEETKQQLRDRAPDTYDFIDTLPARLIPPDTEAPVLILNGDSSVILKKRESYEELGATANDEVDGDLSDQIEITGSVNSDKTGKYTVEYKVTDEAGNEAVKTRTVHVVKLSLAEYLRDKEKLEASEVIGMAKVKHEEVSTNRTRYMIIGISCLLIILTLIIRRNK